MMASSTGTYVIAVSGGVDSVVLLDVWAQKNRDIIVAHFDHGIREDSADDASFVAGLAKKYGFKFEMKREELGVNASEETARERRYLFLREVAKKYNARIVTAHHADDVVETIAINIIRGTGWRGLAVLDSADIERPLLHMRKAEIIEYAKKRQLDWHEDSTNATDKYLRNRLRRKIALLNEDVHRQLLALRDHQVATKQMIEKESLIVTDRSPHSRYFFTMIDDQTALELLRTIIKQEAEYSPLLPQLRRALIAIKTISGNTRHDVGGGISLVFSRTDFVVKVSGK